MKNTGLNECVYNFSVEYEAISVDNILDIHKYLMKKIKMIQKYLLILKKCLL